MIVLAAAPFRLTTKSMVASMPSVAVASETDIFAVVLLTIVATPVARLMVAPLGLLNSRLNSSSLSARSSSSTIGTDTVFTVSPGWNVRVPLVASKSAGANAV